MAVITRWPYLRGGRKAGFTVQTFSSGLFLKVAEHIQFCKFGRVEVQTCANCSVVITDYKLIFCTNEICFSYS